MRKTRYAGLPTAPTRSEGGIRVRHGAGDRHHQPKTPKSFFNVLIWVYGITFDRYYEQTVIAGSGQ